MRCLLQRAAVEEVDSNPGHPEGVIADPRCDPRRLDVTVKVSFKGVVHWHRMLLAALLVRPEPPALTLREVVRHPHGQGGADPGEAVDEDADQRPVDRNRGFSESHDMLLAAC